MNLSHKAILILLALVFVQKAFSQTAPNISYANPHTFKVGNVITPFGPSNTGGTGQVNGQTSAFAGTGTAGHTDGALLSASFNQPMALAQDVQNNLYVADYANNLIRKITPAGTVSTIAGSTTAGYADGQGTAAQFTHPRALIVDTAGNIYVSDFGNNMIRKISKTGYVSTLAGNPTAGNSNGTGTSASFNEPCGLAFDPYGNILVADFLNNIIRLVTPSGAVTTYAGTGVGSAVDGSLTTATFNHPYGLVSDQSGNIYISDRNSNKVRKISASGVVSTLAGTGAAGYAEGAGTVAKFNGLAAITIDNIGNLYVADENNQRIRKVTQAGMVSTVAGMGTQGNVNGTGGTAEFNDPWGVLADNDGGVLYVGDLTNTIRTVAIDPYTIAPDLPLGLNFDSNNGAIYGTAQVSQSQATYVVTEYNGTGKDTAHVILTVAAADTLKISNTQNYIVTYIPRVSGITSGYALHAASSNPSQVETSIEYFDGLGRPIQMVQAKGSPTGFDMIQPMGYDNLGRQPSKYLPYRTSSTSYGSYHATAASDDSVFFKAPPSGVGVITYPKAPTAFEPSQLNRPVDQGAPGTAWQLGTNDHTLKMVYATNNSTSFVTDSVNGMQVAQYNATINSDGSRTLTANGYYAAGQLYVTISKDENWLNGRAGTVEEYKDNEGHVVLKRVYNYTTADQVLSTYYVYDILGNLSFVLPPLSGGDAATTISQTTLNNLCYQYRYDSRNRLSQKKIPGKGWEYMVYNYIDQPVASQDSLQRANKNWIIIKYDGLGRVLLSGIWNNNNTAISPASLQSTLMGITTNLWEHPDSSTTNGYSNVAWPTVYVTTTLTTNYYDAYTNIPGVMATYTLTGNVSKKTKGLLTSKKTAVLNTPTDVLWDVLYYDDLGRLITAYNQHYLGGTANTNNYDLTSTSYDFANEPVTVTRQHFTSANTGIPLVTIANNYIYDHMGRKLMTWEQITNGNSIPTTNTMISKLDYNEIGQVWKKHLHSIDWTTWLQNIGYTYNERGWLLLDTSKLFAMQLYYNTGTSKAYNGNIMYQYWGTPSALTSHYSYAYDKLNRLKAGSSTGNNNETGIAYDLEGNITALTRTAAGTTIDNLAYTYTSGSNNTNQLQSITDATTSDLGLKHGTWAYTYDGNGNLKTDPSKGATGITYGYNLLNLPQTITGAKTITYTYDATGQKLRRVSTTTTGGTGTTDYISGIQYDDPANSGTEALSFIQTEEGKAVPIGSNYDYTYYLGDQLGNTRVTFDDSTATPLHAARKIQADNYYPFGMEQPVFVSGSKNEYLYNKKELQEELGVYDYGARGLDPVLGRWNTIDPLAEISRRWSPYNYVENDPIRFTDPDGMACAGCQFENHWNPEKDHPEWYPGSPKPEPLYNPDKFDKWIHGDHIDAGDHKHGDHHPVPDDYKKTGLPGFPGSKLLPRQGGARVSWDLGKTYHKDDPDKKKLPKGWWGEWDSQHGEVEVYNNQGEHQGAWDPETGEEKPGKQDDNRKPTYNRINSEEPDSPAASPNNNPKIAPSTKAAGAIGIILTIITILKNVELVL